MADELKHADLEREKFEFEKQKAERELALREKEVSFREKEYERSAMLKFFSNPLILAILTASLGFIFDRIMNNIEHRQTVQQQRDKQSSDLIMKAFDEKDPQVIMTKLMLLDTLGYIHLSHQQNDMVVRSFAQRDGNLPLKGDVKTPLIPDAPKDTVYITIDPHIKPIITHRPPIQVPQTDTSKIATPITVSKNTGFTILIGTDILQSEADAELSMALAKYPDARQYRSGRYYLTVVGKYNTYEDANAHVAEVRTKLDRPDAYAIRAQ